MSRISQNILRLGADNSNFKRVMKESDQLISKSKGEWKNYANVLTKELDKTNAELTKMLKNVKTMADVKAIRTMANDAKSLNQELAKMNKGMGGGTGGASGGGGMLSGLMGGLMRLLPAISVIGTGIAAYGARSALVEPNLQLGGLVGRRGLNQVKGQTNRFGFNSMEKTQAAISLAKQTGGTGGLQDIMGMSRGFGLDVGELTGAAGGFRRAGLGQKQSVTALRDTLAAAVAGGLDRSRTSEFIRVTSQMTEELAQTGVTVNPSDIAKIAGTLMAGSKFFQSRPQALQAGLGAVSRLLQQGGGAQFGFAAEALQGAAEKKTGKRLGGAELMFEMSRGMGEKNQTKIPGVFTAKERMGAIFGQLNQTTSGMSPQAKAITTGNLLGINPVLAQEFLEAMENNASMTEKEAKQLEKKMSAADKSPEANALEIMNKTLDGELKGFADYRQKVLEDLGEKIAPTVIEIGKKIAEIGDSISGVASFFGVGKSNKGIVTQAAEGLASFSPAVRDARRGVESDAMFRLGDAKSPMSKVDKSTLEGVIQRQQVYPQYGTLGAMRKELQAKLDSDNSEATKENTRALLELVNKMDTSDQRRRERSALVNTGGRDLGGPVRLIPNGANE